MKTNRPFKPTFSRNLPTGHILPMPVITEDEFNKWFDEVFNRAEEAMKTGIDLPLLQTKKSSKKSE